MSEVGDRIRALRKKRGLTQVQLSRQSGISQSNVSQYERFVEPPASALGKIANTLNTTVDYLVGRTDDPEPPLRLTPDERAILEPLLRRIREGGSVTFGEIAEVWLDNLPQDPGLDDLGKP